MQFKISHNKENGKEVGPCIYIDVFMSNVELLFAVVKLLINSHRQYAVTHHGVYYC